MRSELQSLSKIFSEAIFRIPDYQRGFSWGAKQLKEFWDDLVDLEPAKNHYTGVLTLENVPPAIWTTWEDDRWIIDSKGYAPFHIVDGQQRLTTSIILLQAIVERISDTEQLNYYSRQEIYSKFICQKPSVNAITFALLFGYEKDNPSYEFLKKKVLLLESGNHSLEEETIYTKNLAAAKRFFEEKLSGLELGQIETIFEKVTQRFVFNTFIISNEVDVFVAFETMNNRGKPLSHLEILKNRLIYLSTRVEVQDVENEAAERASLRAAINESWKAAYHYIGQISGERLQDDFFLLIHFFIYFGGEVVDLEGEHPVWDVYEYGEDDTYKEFLLDSVFTARRLVPNELGMLSVGEIYEYAIDLKNAVKTFYQISEPEHSKLSDAEKIWLSRLQRLSSVQRSREFEVPCLLLAIFRKCRTAQPRVRLLEAIERWEVFRLLGKHDFSGRSNLVLLAIKLLSGKISADDLLKTLTEEAEEFAQSSILKKRLNVVGKEWGSYKWPFIKYFLFEYEQSLKARSRTNRDKLDWRDFNGEDFNVDYVTVEHIYPQKPVDKSWADFKRFTVKQRNVMRHSMGNLLPLSRHKNSALGNKSFDEKKCLLGESVGYVYGCYSEQEVAQCSNWTGVELGKRSLRLLAFFEERWAVGLGSVDEKLGMLGLGFLATDVASTQPLPKAKKRRRAS